MLTPLCGLRTLLVCLLFAVASATTLSAQAPTADFSGLPTVGSAPLTVFFSDQSSGTVTGWVWSFGDTNGSLNQNPVHTYLSPGTFTVTLTVSGPGGSDAETKADYIVAIGPPEADFTASPTSGTAPLTVSFTDTTTPRANAWSWDFGDGFTATVQNPSHTYATPGTYTVSLTATTLGGTDSETKLDYVTVIQAGTATYRNGGPGFLNPAAYTAPPPVIGTTWVAEIDTRAVPGTLATVIFGRMDPIPGVSTTFGRVLVNLSSAFLFDSFQASLSDIHTHAFTLPNDISLVGRMGATQAICYTNVSGTTGQFLNAVDVTAGLPPMDPRPSASFTAATTSGGPAPLAVAFTDASTGPITSYTWDFGDGGSSTLANPTHTYTTGGTYSVSLVVEGPGGFDIQFEPDYVTITDPVPDFTATPLSGPIPLAVAFTDLTSGTASSWSWDFGDGESSTLQDPTHSYATPGTYTVSLTAAGPGGANTETKADYILVTPGPPAADFIATPASGRAPLAVSFADASVGVASSWSWDFGDGGSSTAQNPMHTYATEGTYTVSLTATGPGGSDTETKVDYIVVTPGAPTPDFSGSPLSGAEPLLVSFTDASTGVVTGWSWDFGDAVSSTEQNPTDFYTSEGTYTVSLTAIGPGGSSNETKIDYVTVTVAAPVADFSGTPLTGDAPLSVAFTDASTGVATSWSWDFGDTGGSTQQNPTHVYTVAGTYSVSLSTSGPGGTGIETKPAYVTVMPRVPSPDFSGTPLNGNEPLTVSFTDLTSGVVTSWSWSFGDGGSATVQNPSHTYLAAGTYTVSLTVDGPGGTATGSKNDYVEVLPPAPIASFVGSPLAGNVPLAVSFSDASSGTISSWSWNFGDSGGSTLQNPTHVYTSAGTYSVALSVTGPGGSGSFTRVDYVTVLPPAPVADFSGSPLTGTEPLLVSFTDATINPVTAWTWSFGDGSGSTLQNPSHTYSTPGTYSVSLTATGPGGSGSETKTDYITVSFAPPVAALSGTPLSGNEPLTVSFSDDSTNIVTAWAWSFGDGGSSSLEDPSHTYLSAGTYTVSLTATGPGGSNTATETDYITVLPPPPAADFSGSPLTGIAPLAVSFTDTTANPVTAWSWDFGDGGSATVQNPSYSYASPGTYTVSLTATGPGGSDAETKADYIVVAPFIPTANFTGSPTSGVNPLTVSFTDLSTGVVTGWQWDFGDSSTATLQSPTYTYLSPGTYTVTLMVSGPGGNDTEVKSDYVLVSDGTPVASFSGSPTSGSQPLTVAFTDQSAGNVSSWQWDFGDGGTSSLQNPTYTYTSLGTYDVSLTATGPAGMDTSLEAGYIQVLPPAPQTDFIGAPRRGQAPLDVSFSDLTTGAVTAWDWDFGDSGSSTLQNPLHTYSFSGTYAVSLTASGPGGAVTETKTSYVIVTPGALVDGSFELQTAGNAPGPPWPTIGGTHLVLPDSPVTSDNGMPANGSNWLAVNALGSVAAAPPSNPGGAGTAPSGAVGVAQSFFHDPSNPALVFSAAFVLNDDLASVATNDFLSVDITDGMTTHNLYYADSFSSFPNVSSRYGLPMTDTEQVGTNIEAIFPGASASTLLTLTIMVGNGGDGQDSSIGYFDRALERNLASTSFRNGNEINPWCYNAAPPVLGETWMAEIDHRDRPSATFMMLLVRGTPSSPFNVGFGEILVGGPVIFDIFQVADADGITNYSVPLPNELAMMGTAYTQGLILGVPDQTFCNAIDMSLGLAPAEARPSVDFMASTTMGAAPLAVSFTDTSTGSVSSWEWDFGDGSSSTLQNPTHTYGSPGTYSVGLRVQGPGGLDIERKFDHIQAQ